MKLKVNFHAAWSPWSPWARYVDRDSFVPYQSRYRKLFCGKLVVATLVQDTRPSKGPFYMYAAGCPAVIRGTSAFRVARRFLREVCLQ
jgi:hypothetical protein